MLIMAAVLQVLGAGLQVFGVFDVLSVLRDWLRAVRKGAPAAGQVFALAGAAEGNADAFGMLAVSGKGPDAMFAALHRALSQQERRMRDWVKDYVAKEATTLAEGVSQQIAEVASEAEDKATRGRSRLRSAFSLHLPVQSSDTSRRLLI